VSLRRLGRLSPSAPWWRREMMALKHLMAIGVALATAPSETGVCSQAGFHHDESGGYAAVMLVPPEKTSPPAPAHILISWHAASRRHTADHDGPLWSVQESPVASTAD
jgi:hypothetical protein